MNTLCHSRPLCLATEIWLMISCLFETNKRYYPYFITGIPPAHPPHRTVHLNSQTRPEDPQRKRSCPSAIPVNTDLKLFTAMFLVCKELSLEVTRFFYSENDFVLQPEHLETWVHRIGLNNSRCIRSIVLSTSNSEDEFPIYIDDNGPLDSPYSKFIAQRRLEKATRWQRAQVTLGKGRLPSLRKITFGLALRCCDLDQVDHRQLITALTDKRAAWTSRPGWRRVFPELLHVVFELAGGFPLSVGTFLPYVNACKVWEVDVVVLTGWPRDFLRNEWERKLHSSSKRKHESPNHGTRPRN